MAETLHILKIPKAPLFKEVSESVIFLKTLKVSLSEADTQAHNWKVFRGPTWNSFKSVNHTVVLSVNDNS